MKLIRYVKNFLAAHPWVFAIIGPGLLILPSLIEGDVLYWGTPALQFIPWQTYAWSLVGDGYWPVWNPLNGMGAPLIANYQLGWYYPPNLILGVFNMISGAIGVATGYTILTFAHFVWVGIGMQRLLKELQLSLAAQIIGAAAFQMSGYLLTRSSFFSMVWTAAWFPWLIFLVLRICNKAALQSGTENLKREFIQLLVVLTMVFLAGHAQLAWYLLSFTAMFSFVIGWAQGGFRAAVRLFMVFTAFAVIAAGISSVQLLPTGEYLLNSQRASAYGAEQAFTYSFSPLRSLEFFFPKFFGTPGDGNYWGYGSYWEDAIYIGVLPFILVLTTLNRRLLAKGFHPTIKRFLWCMAAVGGVLALGSNTRVFEFLYSHVPTFNMFQAPARFLIWPIFSLSVLAGYGLSEWSPLAIKSQKRLALGVAAALAIGLAGLAALGLLPGLNPTIPVALIAGSVLISSALVLLIRVSVPDKRSELVKWEWIAIGIVFVDLCFMNLHTFPTAPARMFELHPDDSGIAGRVYLSADDEYLIKFSRVFRFRNFQPIEPAENAATLFLPNLNLIENYEMITNFDPLVPVRYKEWKEYVDSLPSGKREPWLRFSGIGAVAEFDPKTQRGVNVKKLGGAASLHWVPCSISSQEEDSFSDTKRIFSSNLEDRFVVVESQTGNLLCEENESPGVVSMRNTTPVSMKADSMGRSSGWIVWAETWYPGWSVTIDGKQAELLRANYVFMGVFVPAGAHEVEFAYHPNSTYLGAGISLLFLMFSIFGVSWLSRLYSNRVVQ